MAKDPMEITITSPNLRQVMAEAKAIGPSIQRKLRKDLRGVGDDIIKDQRSILSAPLPGKAVKSGQRVRLVQARGKKKAYLRAVNVYQAEPASRSRTRGMRTQIKASLKTRVVAGATRSGISIRANKTNKEGFEGVEKVWNKKIIRHPVFKKSGRDAAYVTQFGQPYWWEPINRGQLAARQKALEAIDNAINPKGAK